MMMVYIPTRGRTGQQITWRNLPRSIQDNTRLVCDHDDQLDPGYAASGRLIRLPSDLKGIGHVRQFIISQHDVRKYGPKILMLDDDLRFFTRRSDDTTKFMQATATDIRDCFEVIERLLGQYAHAGILAREGGNRKPPGVEENTRLLRALAYDVNVLRKEEVHFNRLVVMEDFDVALQLLRKGYKSACLCDYVQDQTRSNAPGGCSIYRTLEKQAEGANGLAILHPKFVKVVTKTTSTAWNGATRSDVQVRWKDAYNSSQRTTRQGRVSK